MNANTNGSDNSPQDDLDVLIADYLDAVDAGSALSPREFARQYPDKREQLLEFFEALSLIEEMAGPTLAESLHGQQLGLAAPETSTADPLTTRGPGDEAAFDFLEDSQIGPYTLKQHLGNGAMGAVYLAWDTRLDREVALKFPYFRDGKHREEGLRRFEREAKVAASLRNPHLCPVYDFGQQRDLHYIAMAYIKGQTLKGWRVTARPSPQQIAALIAKVASALQVAHRAGVVHRDLKPGNIMIDDQGEPVVMDFGLACRIDHTESTETATGALVGSPAYMSPEQILGDADQVGPASDVYSLGVVLYELLTGRLPYRGTVVSVIGQIVSAEPPRVEAIAPHIPPQLATICHRMLDKSPEQRFANMDEVASALQLDSTTAPVLAERADNLPVPAPRTGLLLVGLVLAAIAFGAWAMSSSRNNTNRRVSENTGTANTTAGQTTTAQQPTAAPAEQTTEQKKLESDQPQASEPRGAQDAHQADQNPDAAPDKPDENEQANGTSEVILEQSLIIRPQDPPLDCKDGDWSNARVLQLAPLDDWQLTAKSPPAGAAADLPEQPIPLAPPTHQSTFFERARVMRIIPDKGLAFISRVNPPPGKTRTVRLEVLDLREEKSLRSYELPQEYVPMDVGPNGKWLITRSDKFGFGKKSVLQFWQLEPKALKFIENWKPYPSGRGASVDVTWVKFIDDSSLLTSNGKKIGHWQLESAEIATPNASYSVVAEAATLSEDRQTLYTLSEQGLYILDVPSGEVQGSIAVDMSRGAKLSGSPQGKRIALMESSGRLRIWDGLTGEIERDMHLPQLHGNGELVWLDDNYLWSKNSDLIDTSRRIVLWRYHNVKAGGARYGEQQALVLSGGPNGLCLCFHKLPHDEAVAAVTKTPDEMLIWSPGRKVRIKLDCEDHPELEKTARESLEARLTKAGYLIDDDAICTFEVKLIKGHPRPYNYREIGGFPRGYGSTTIVCPSLEAKLVLGDKELWKDRRTLSPPPMLHLEPGQTVQQFIDNYTRPNARFFGTLPIPREIGQPGTDNGSYGQSRLSAQGIGR